MAFNIKSIIKSTIFALVVTFILLIALAGISYFCAVSEKIINIGSYAAIVLGALLGAAAAARAAEKKIVFHSAAVSLLFFICLVTVSWFLCGIIRFNLRFLAVAGAVFFSGFLGFVIGK